MNNNDFKITLMEDGLFDTCIGPILDNYPDYFMGPKPENIEDTDETVLIEMFDTIEQIIQEMDMDNYELASYDMGYYFGVTTKETISDENIKFLLSLVPDIEVCGDADERLTCESINADNKRARDLINNL